MLKSLYIRNYVLINQLDVNLHPGLNIITGETGAGKSILLGAIELLMGQRADLKCLRNTEEKCVIEGVFDIGNYALQQYFIMNNIDYADECIIRREIAPSGKSRAFINDTPVNLEMLKELGFHLMDIHSQHDTLLLGNDQYQIEVLDAYAGNQQLAAKYKASYSEYRHFAKLWDDWHNQQSRLLTELDYLKYVLNELEKANLQPGEQDDLEKELELLQNAEEIKLKLNEGLQILDGEQQSVLASLKSLQQLLSKLAPYDQQLAQLSERCGSTVEELKDILSELHYIEHRVEQNPERLLKVSNRLDLLYTLCKKYHQAHSDALIRYRDEIKEKISSMDGAVESAGELEQKMQKAKENMNQLGHELRTLRCSKKDELAQSINLLLKDLGMPEALFEIKVEPTSPVQNGMDKVTFLFSANKGKAPQELKSIASGGEISRVMLAIKYVQAGKMELPTIIFDEIDTGISGEVARKVASMINKMAQQHQLIAITHTPQIAAAADQHFYVFKDSSGQVAESKLKVLDRQEQIHELAQMLSGAQPTSTALKNAHELRQMVKGMAN